MSVFFANLSRNGDHIGVINPATREKLLAAIYELKLFGPSLNDNPCPRMSPAQPSHGHHRTSPRHRPSSGRQVTKPGKHRKPNRESQGVDIHKSSHACSDQASRSTPHYTTSSTLPAHGVLKDKIHRKKSPPVIHIEQKFMINWDTSHDIPVQEDGSVKVYVQVLHNDIEHKTIEITTQTTSEQLVSSVLDVCDAFTKDPNVYYIAMETGIKRKDSGLPISKMIVLENEARPLEMQECQPQGETKFHLKMKSGGLVRVRVNVLCPGATHKTLYIARNTTARQLIKLIIKSCSSDESPDDFLVRESSANFEVDRMLEDQEHPLDIQSHWKPEDDVSFFLTRKVGKVSKSPSMDASTTSTSEAEHKKPLERKLSAMDVLLARLRHGKHHERKCSKEKEEEAMANPERRPTESSIDSGYGKSDNEQIGENSMAPIEETSGGPPFENEADPEKRQRMIENLRQRRTSLDALDLHNVPTETPPIIAAKRRVSQIARFRDKFFEYKKSEIDALDLHDNDNDNNDNNNNNNDKTQCVKRQRRISQIDRFRDKFMEYYHVKNEDPYRRASCVVTSTRQPETQPEGRSLSSSDADRLDVVHRFHRDPLSRCSSSSGSSEQELGSVFGSTPPYQLDASRSFNENPSPNFSLFSMLESRQLVSVTLCREHGKALGLELAQVTRSGHASDKDIEEGDVVYVLHDGEGNNSVVSSPNDHRGKDQFVPIQTTQQSAQDSNDSISGEEHHHESPHNGHPKPESLLHEVQNRPVQRKMGLAVIGGNDALPLSRPGSAQGQLRPRVSLEPRPSSALAHLRQRDSPAPSPGVVIVGISNGSVADEDGRLREDDMIVEVNGKHMMNRSLDAVIASLQAEDEVHLVVARDIPDERESPNTETSEPVQPTPTYHAELLALTEQVQQLVTKVTEMQEALGKKDKTISTLKKALVKKKLKISSKDKLTEGVQVLV